MENVRSFINFKNESKSKDAVYVTYNINTGLYNTTRVYADGLEFNGCMESKVCMMADSETIAFMVPESYIDIVGLGLVDLCKQLVEVKDIIIDQRYMLVFRTYGDLGSVLDTFKAGEPISRNIWDNKQIIYRKGYDGISPNKQTREQWGMIKDETIYVEPHIQMKHGNVLSEYSLTVHDIVADDWFIVKTNNNCL